MHFYSLGRAAQIRLLAWWRVRSAPAKPRKAKPITHTSFQSDKPNAAQLLAGVLT